jgi:starch phosphorylase
MASANPGLTRLLGETIGDGWVTRLDELRGLARHADDAAFRARWHAVKHANKVRLAELVKHDCQVSFDPDALFDVQVKRIHEYKRQLLNILHVIHLYARLKHGEVSRDGIPWTPRCVLIGGKAAPGYFMAKRIISLVCKVADMVNGDDQVGDRLKVAFLPNYRVSAMEIIAPGTDLSEQISTAGKEASGTGNMKFMMNGAVTIGTLDGANIEIREEGGGRQLLPVRPHRRGSGSHPRPLRPQRPHRGRQGPETGDGLLESGHFNHFEPGLFEPIVQAIRSPHDPWLVAADFRAFVDAQAARGRGLPGPGELDADEHPQHRRQRQVLHRPHHGGIQRGNLEAHAGGGRPGDQLKGEPTDTCRMAARREAAMRAALNGLMM